MQNVYIEFVKKHYQKVKADHPGAKQTDIMRKVAELYRKQKSTTPSKGKGRVRPAVWKEPLIIS